MFVVIYLLTNQGTVRRRMLFNIGQNKDSKWQETEYLLRVLLSRLHLLLICPDPHLDKNIREFVRVLRDGQSIHEQHTLMKAISNRINKLKSTALIAAGSQNNSREDHSSGQELVFEVFRALLENINFPANYMSRIEDIKFDLTNEQAVDRNLQLVTAIGSLTRILDDIFERVDKDKRKIDTFLKQINSDLKSMDEGISESHELQNQKQALEASIDIKVNTEVHEMEGMLTSQTENDIVKKNVLGSLQQIRSHMETFKEQERQRNERASTVTGELQRKLENMEKECIFLKQQVLEKQQQVLSDPVTGIRNRLAYEEAIQMECDRFKRYGRPFTLMLLDLDHFKNVDDNYGLGAGDKVLQMVARTLANNIRNVDFVARYGDEEFVVIFPELGVKDARMIGQKLCKAVADQNFEFAGQNIEVTVSGGVARVHEGDTPESLFERADNALYLAKEHGRNRIEIE